MEIAVLSDIHGNYHALKRCMDYSIKRGIETFFFLGDYIGELAYPERTMHLLYEIQKQYNCWFVRGNKEERWLKFQETGGQELKENSSTTGCLYYALHHLTKQDFRFFKELPVMHKIEFPSMPAITICHGSPENTNEALLPIRDEKRTYQYINSTDSSILLCGHTHIQVKVEYNKKCAINAGAVGVPLHSGGKTQFLILKEECRGGENFWKEEFISLDYDTEKTIRELQESGLTKHAPYWCQVTENLLRNGNLSHVSVLKRVMELCKQDTGICIWPEIAEKYWKQAVDEMLPVHT